MANKKHPMSIYVVAFVILFTAAKADAQSSYTDSQNVEPSIGREYIRTMIQSAYGPTGENKKIGILKKELELIIKMIKELPDNDPRRADLLLKIADNYRSFYYQLNTMVKSLDSKIPNSTGKTKAKFEAQQKKLKEMVRNYREKSIKAYVELRNKYQDYPDYDKVLFAIAYEIDQLAAELNDKNKIKAYRERSRVFYKELIRNHPRSRFIPYSWMTFGEYYLYEARDFERSIRAYEKVIEWGEPNNPLFAVAMYCKAWCLFNMQEYEKALHQFVEVAEYADVNPTIKGLGGIAKKSRMDMVGAFMKIGKPSMAWSFFEKVGGNQSKDMLVKLALLYYDEGQKTEAIIVYNKLEKLRITNYARRAEIRQRLIGSSVTNQPVGQSNSPVPAGKRQSVYVLGTDGRDTPHKGTIWITSNGIEGSGMVGGGFSVSGTMSSIEIDGFRLNLVEEIFSGSIQTVELGTIPVEIRHISNVPSIILSDDQISKLKILKKTPEEIAAEERKKYEPGDDCCPSNPSLVRQVLVPGGYYTCGMENGVCKKTYHTGGVPISF